MAETRRRQGARRLTLGAAVTALAVGGFAMLPVAHAQPAQETTAQTLSWTADDELTAYASAPQTAVAGEATLVFENSEATGNTTGMQHTLTFTTSDPEYNQDVDVNILASPNDAEGGVHEETVELTPGTYHFYCTIPGHLGMEGELVVTEDDGAGGEA